MNYVFSSIVKRFCQNLLLCYIHLYNSRSAVCPFVNLFVYSVLLYIYGFWHNFTIKGKKNPLS